MAAYGQSKFCAERYLGLYGRLHGLSTVTLRSATSTGRARTRSARPASSRSSAASSATAGGRRSTATARQTRDYVYVGDVVARPARRRASSDVGGEINVGTGKETTVLDLVDAMRELEPAAAASFEPDLRRRRASARSSAPASTSPAPATSSASWPRPRSSEGMRRTLEATP